MVTRESPHLGTFGRTRCLGLAGWCQIPDDVRGRVPASGEFGRSCGVWRFRAVRRARDVVSPRARPANGTLRGLFHVHALLANLPERESGVALALSSNPGFALPALCIDPKGDPRITAWSVESLEG